MLTIGKKCNKVNINVRCGCKTEALDLALVLNKQVTSFMRRYELHDQRPEHAGLLFSIAMLLEVAARLVAQQLVQVRLNAEMHSVDMQRSASFRHYMRQDLGCPAHS